MKDLFEDIRSAVDFEGILLVSSQGEILYQEFLSPPSKGISEWDLWPVFMDSLQGIREAELVFEKSRLYIRQTDMGYLVIFLGAFAPIAKIRLYCDVLLPSLKKIKTGKGLRGIFKGRK